MIFITSNSAGFSNAMLFQVISHLVPKQALLEHAHFSQFSPRRSRWEDSRPSCTRTTLLPTERGNGPVMPHSSGLVIVHLQFQEGEFAGDAPKRELHPKASTLWKLFVWWRLYKFLNPHQPKMHVPLVSSCSLQRWIANLIFPCKWSGFKRLQLPEVKTRDRFVSAKSYPLAFNTKWSSRFISVQKTNCQKCRNMDLSGFWSVEKSRIHQLRSLAHVTHLTEVNFQG